MSEFYKKYVRRHEGNCLGVVYSFREECTFKHYDVILTVKISEREYDYTRRSLRRKHVAVCRKRAHA